MIPEKVKQCMEDEGWVFECLSPLEIRFVDAFASNLAARIVVEYYWKELEIAEGIWD